MKIMSRFVALLLLSGSLIAGTAGVAAADPPPVPDPVALITSIGGPGVCC